MIDDSTRVRCPLCDGHLIISLESKVGTHRAIKCWLCTFGSIDKSTYEKWIKYNKPVEKPDYW